MHQSIPAAPSPPAPPPLQGYCGAFALLVSPGDGAFPNFTLPGGRAFANPGANTESFDTHAASYQQYNYTEDFTGKTSRLAHLSRTGKT